MANPKGNPQNLTPFKKGNQAAKGHGRPPILPDLNKLLAKVLGEEKQDMTAAEAILKALLSRATKGDVRAAEILMDRGWGKTITQVDITTLGEPIKAPNIIIPGPEVKP